MNKPSTYRVQGLLPRTDTIIDLFKGDSLEEAEKFASKNVKYFPRLIIKGGCHANFGKESKTYLEVIENPDYVDKSRDRPKTIKIGKLKRNTPFAHHIVYEDSKKISFLVRYKKDQVRVCTVDANMRDTIQDYLEEYKHDWRVKIHRGSLPLVYMRVRGHKHITLLELVTGSPMSGYIVFKDNNPYNYQRSNIIRTLRAVSRNKPRGVANYYGVKPTPSGKYRGLISKKGIKYTTKVNKDPVIVAKEIDQICMELFGRMAARNFPYEYYLAFEPQYIRNVK
jgi:hypothetical protein